MKLKSKLYGITQTEDLQIAINFDLSAVVMIHYDPGLRHPSITEMLNSKKNMSSNAQLFIELISLNLHKSYIFSGGLSATNITSLVNGATQWKRKPIGLDYNWRFEKYYSVKYSKKISKLIHEMNRLGVNAEGAILA